MEKFNAAKTDRIDRLIREAEFPGKKWLSRAALEELIREGRVFVQGKRVVKPGITVAAGETVTLDLPPLGLLRAAQKAEPVWQDAGGRLALFNKRPGISTYPLLPWKNDTFANEVAAFAQDDFAELADPPILEGGILQRLDRDTSGLILVAWDAATKKTFRDAFSNGQIEKRYQAIVSGDWLQATGSHSFSLRSLQGGKKVEAISGGDAGIEITVVKSKDAHAWLEVRTRHGARHIVRATLAALGIPLVGDSLYGGEPSAAFHQLHAGQIITQVFPDFPSSLVLAPPQSFLDCAGRLGLH